MWNDLTMQERADVISMAVKAGLRDIDSIRSFYNETIGSERRFDNGEDIRKTVSKVNSSKANFVNRLKGHLYAEGGKERKKGRYWIEDSSILPELVVTPSGTDYVRDEAGNPAITVGALREINPNIPIYERNSRELKNNQYNTELPQWIVDQNADNYANAISPGIGDLIAAGLKPFDATMPSRWVGLLDSDNNKGLLHLFADDNRGFYINNDPKGAFNKSFHDTFPLAASIGNMAGDAITLPLLTKGIRNAGKKAMYKAADRYIFIPHQNSFTRGIGITDAGLQDAVNTGVFRGNPRGTEQTAKVFDKMFLRNRNNFRDIVRDTKIKGIESRYQSRTLTEEDFNALKEASKKYTRGEPTIGGSTIRLRGTADPLSNYKNYQEYIDDVNATIARTDKMPSRVASGEISPNTELSEPMWFEDESGRMFLPQGKPFLERFGPNSDYLADGTPLSYWYADGRNPITEGHAYAKSNYGVRVNNPKDYQPFMHELHLHPSFFRSPKFADTNVEVFRRGPFGLTVKLDKKTLQPMWKRDLFKYGLPTLGIGLTGLATSN